MKRVTVDTNIFISALLWRGVPERALDVFKQRRAMLVLSEDILSELDRKLRSDKLHERVSRLNQSVSEIVSSFRDLAKIVEGSTIPTKTVRDPKDEIILACVLGGKSEFLVTGDKDLLDLVRFNNCTIVSPSEFLNIMAADVSDGAEDSL